MKLAIATLASTLIATAAMAQTANDGSTSTDSTTTAATQNAGDMQMAQDKIRQQLTKAGFEKVQVLDASYLVRAQTEDGDTVLMVINPPGGNAVQTGASGSDTSSGTADSDTSGEQ